MTGGDIDITMRTEGNWQITLIGQTTVPADLGITLTFEDGKAQFFAGCNSINAVPVFGQHDFRFEVVGLTRKMCAPEIMERETALLDAISEVDLLRPVENGLVFYDATNKAVLAAMRTAP